MAADKTSSDPHLLAKVLEDARRADRELAESYGQIREKIILHNEDLFRRYSELSDGRRLVAYFAKIFADRDAIQLSG